MALMRLILEGHRMFAIGSMPFYGESVLAGVDAVNFSL